MGYSLALLHHGDPGTSNLDALLVSLNERDTVPEPKITTRDLKTVILALQKDCTSRLNTLKSDFELSFRSQQNRIRHLEKKVAYQEKLINFLVNINSFSTAQTQPEKSHQPHVHNAINDIEALNSTGYSSLDIKEMRKENWSEEIQMSLKQARQGSHQFLIKNIFA